MKNLAVKKFRRMLRKHMKNIELFQANIREARQSKEEKGAKRSPKLEQLLAKFSR